MLLLLLLLGGAAVAYVAASYSAGPAADFWRAALNTQTLEKIFNTPSPHERFMDDFYFAYGYGEVNEPFDEKSKFRRYQFPAAHTMSSQQAELTYLGDVPYTANARIDAIMKRVDSFGAAPGIDPGEPKTLIEAFAKNSFLRLTQVASKIQTAYSDVSNYADMAEALGVDVGEIEKQAGIVLAAGKKTRAYEVVESVVADVAPVATVLSAGIKGYADKGSYGAVENAAKALGDFAPVIGNILDAGFALAESYVDAQAKYDSEQCKNTQDKILSTMKSTLDLQLPVPWQQLVDSPISCAAPDPKAFGAAHSYHDTPEQESALSAFRHNYDELTGDHMSNEYRAFITRWWLASQLFMSDPRVLAIFHALGRSYFIASDEQVLLVAAPIAASEGLDIVDFAKRLWARSAGWRSADSALFQNEEVTYTELTDDCESASKCYKTAGTGQFYVANASFLQWAVLARDAFQLADELKGRTPPTSILGDPATLSKLVVTKPTGGVEKPDITAHADGSKPFIIDNLPPFKP